MMVYEIRVLRLLFGGCFLWLFAGYKVPLNAYYEPACTITWLRAFI